MNIKIVNITPELADRWLQEHWSRLSKKQFTQRNISKLKVNQYISDMRNGYWRENHQGIAFDKEGNLLDGQHRLIAIKESGLTIPMIVVTGLPVGSNNDVSVMDTIDCGRARTLADRLHISHGATEPHSLAAIIRGIAYVLMDYHRATISVGQALEIKNIYQKDLDILFGDGKVSRQPSWVASPLALYHHAYPAKGKAFIKQFVDLTGLSPGHPIQVWLKWNRWHPDKPYANKVHGYNVFINCLWKYHLDEQLNSLRTSKDAVEWLISSQGKHYKTVRDLLGASDMGRLTIAKDHKVKITKNR